MLSHVPAWSSTYLGVWVTRELTVIETTGNSERGASMILVGHGLLDSLNWIENNPRSLVLHGNRFMRSPFSQIRVFVPTDEDFTRAGTWEAYLTWSFHDLAQVHWLYLASCHIKTLQTCLRDRCLHVHVSQTLEYRRGAQRKDSELTNTTTGRMVNVLEHCAMYWPLNLLTVFMVSSSHLWKELLASSVTMCQRCT